MKAAFIRQTGPADVIEVGSLPDPLPGPDEALVRVSACAVNPIDTAVRSGAVAMPLPVPFVVGCDLAGTVVAVGPRVATLAPGDRVWGSNQGLLGRQGTFAEQASVDARWLYKTPAGVDDVTAAAAALVGITAHLGLVHRARLQPGETIFVNGGAGGVGGMVVQIAKRLGGRVIAAGSTAKKRATIAGLGADVVIERGGADAASGNLARRVRSHAPDGVDIWWELAREPDLDAAIEGLAEGGRLVLMAGRAGRPPFPVGPFYVKGCSAHGFVMFKEPWQRQAAAAIDLNRWLAAGTVRPLIDRILPLESTADAHRLQEAGTAGLPGGSGLAVVGKIVVVP
jgi:NADPH2:quinone reductase